MHARIFLLFTMFAYDASNHMLPPSYHVNILLCIPDLLEKIVPHLMQFINQQIQVQHALLLAHSL